MLLVAHENVVHEWALARQEAARYLKRFPMPVLSIRLPFAAYDSIRL